ncbi:hypothetical protein ACLMM6_12690 [Xanthomonas campestris pv. incanae]|uniref:hypothetical protein n=1 Tax=Xanthomonas campestris TaxID=339 RepID=UPI003F4CEF47
MLNNNCSPLAWVCKKCLGDEELMKLCEVGSADQVCCACGSRGEWGATPWGIADLIRVPLETHFEVDVGIYPGYEKNLTDLISKATGCKSAVALNAISNFLEEEFNEASEGESDEDAFYWPGQTYSKKKSPFDSEEHERWCVVSDWDHVAHDLVHVTCPHRPYQ